jgi:hypothetical protein
MFLENPDEVIGIAETTVVGDLANAHIGVPQHKACQLKALSLDVVFEVLACIADE